MASWETLQEMLKERAQSNCAGRLLFYALGNTCSPMEVTYTCLYEEATKISRTIQSLK